MKSLARIMKAEITIPDFSSISKRCIALPRHLLALLNKSVFQHSSWLYGIILGLLLHPQ